MRQAAEQHAWRLLERAEQSYFSSDLIALEGGTEILLNRRCQVLTGLNGAGKTRTLRQIASELGTHAVVLPMHELCERVRAVLSSRKDIDEMEAEVGPTLIDPSILPTVSRVVGRSYGSLEWYDLELESTSSESQKWPWADADSDRLVTPHFKVEHRGITYSSTEMGLGELSAHLVLWILWQYRESPGTTILLDEPDAFLPPSTRIRLLAAILSMARDYEWRLILTSHSHEFIGAAIENGALGVLVRRGAQSSYFSVSEHGPGIVRDLLPPNAKDVILFCEDESAAALTRAILAQVDEDVLARTGVLWKDGTGYLHKLSQALPRTEASPVQFSLVYDGDQRPSTEPSTPGRTRWPSLFLPTSGSPDTLFMAAADRPDKLAAAIGKPEAEVEIALDALEGADPHDWVNGLCARLGPRPVTLAKLAELWAQSDRASCDKFVAELRAGLSL